MWYFGSEAPPEAQGVDQLLKAGRAVEVNFKERRAMDQKESQVWYGSEEKENREVVKDRMATGKSQTENVGKNERSKRKTRECRPHTQTGKRQAEGGKGDRKSVRWGRDVRRESIGKDMGTSGSLRPPL